MVLGNQGINRFLDFLIDELGADLVVMGTHGKGFLEHAFLGSVAEKVLHRIKIPVLTIPIPKETDIRLSI